MKNAKLTKTLLIIAIVVLATVAFAAEEAAAGGASFAAIGKGLAIGLGLLGTGMAQSAIGAAAVGAVAEDRRNFGTALIFFLIPETLAIFGLAFSFLIN
ncbi:F0F1 ATP synthase subunit C [Meiothermus rufus]|uniref:F0F1 ATP synthase subunit C n=1 Tax=Meiothermus rufus TaxID=604332 RepID=UPI000411D543|nr:F0F1 ATP synthase subunit C [Meiothermus rufus]